MVLDTKSRALFGKTPLAPSFESHILPKAVECLSLIKDPQTGSMTLMEVIRFLPKDRRGYKRELPNDYVYWIIIPYASNAPIPAKQFDRSSREAAAELSQALTAHWHPSLRPLIEHQDPSQTGVFHLLNSDSKYLMRSWEPNARVTLMGDAAHSMLLSQYISSQISTINHWRRRLCIATVMSPVCNHLSRDHTFESTSPRHFSAKKSRKNHGHIPPLIDPSAEMETSPAEPTPPSKATIPGDER